MTVTSTFFLSLFLTVKTVSKLSKHFVENLVLRGRPIISCLHVELDGKKITKEKKNFFGERKRKKFLVTFLSFSIPKDLAGRSKKYDVQ